MKAAARVFDEIDNGKAGVPPSSKSVEFIETLREGFHSKGLTGHLSKVDPNESGSLDHFAFVRWYLDKEVSLDCTYEVESLLGLGLQYQSYWSSVRSFIH